MILVTIRVILGCFVKGFYVYALRSVNNVLIGMGSWIFCLMGSWITLSDVELGMDLILSDLLITLCYVELGMDLLFSCLVSCICWFLAWFHIYVVFLMGFVFLKIN